jgi:hypothetical protein
VDEFLVPKESAVSGLNAMIFPAKPHRRRRPVNAADDRYAVILIHLGRSGAKLSGKCSLRDLTAASAQGSEVSSWFT